MIEFTIGKVHLDGHNKERHRVLVYMDITEILYAKKLWSLP